MRSADRCALVLCHCGDADIQYCDCDDASNFAGTEIRAYRGSLSQTAQAVAHWNACGVDFVVQLGDLIDGQNAGKYGAGLHFDEPQSEVAFSAVASELAQCRVPIFHAIGNHVRAPPPHELTHRVPAHWAAHPTREALRARPYVRGPTCKVLHARSYMQARAHPAAGAARHSAESHIR